ncbi:MAG TPA: hypothetical protein VMB21_20285, partial [Candidatus Limnocylindria bacterium]|nr:hypothetical protein [Candidatus Limnocylindria bacterium]
MPNRYGQEGSSGQDAHRLQGDSKIISVILADFPMNIARFWSASRRLMALLFCLLLGNATSLRANSDENHTCISVWTPGNFTLYETYSVPTNQPCPEIHEFTGGGIESILYGCSCRTLVGPSGHAVPALGNISLATSAALTFTNFDVEIGPYQIDGSPMFLINKGIWEIQTDNDLLTVGNPGNYFENRGIFEKTGGDGTARVTIPFRDYQGTIIAQQGTIDFLAATNNFNGTHFSGPGTILIHGATAAFSSTIFPGPGPTSVDCDASFAGVGTQSTSLVLAGGTFTDITEGTGALF